jgi:hypothetical protein
MHKIFCSRFLKMSKFFYWKRMKSLVEKFEIKFLIKLNKLFSEHKIK